MAVALGDAERCCLRSCSAIGNRGACRTSMRYESHRSAGVASIFIFVKRRVMMPLRAAVRVRRDNFERHSANHVLFACVQELAIENARLRRDLQSLSQNPRR